LGNYDANYQEKTQNRQQQHHKKDKLYSSSNNGLSNSRTNATTYQPKTITNQGAMDPDEAEYTEWMKKHLQDLSVAENQSHFKKASD
jgi:hypothetical protein